MRHPSTPRRGLVVGCILVAAVAAGCGGTAGSDGGDTTVQVEASNTAEGRFPDEELLRSQDEAAAEAEAEARAAEEAAEAEPPEGEVPPAEREPVPQAAEPEPEPSGIPAGELAPGLYTSATFQPRFSLEIEEGWLSFQAELEDFVALSPVDDLDLTISFLSPKLATALIDEESEYTDADPAGEQLLDPTAFDYFAWINEHPRYEAGEVRSELLAGRAVSSFDATLKSGYRWQGCLARCALLVATSDGELLAQEVGYRERLYATDVDDLTLIVSIAAPEEKFDAFVGRAVQLLSTLELAADADALEPVDEPAPGDDATPPDPAPQELPASEPASGEEAPAEEEAREEEEPAEEPERLPPAPLES